jgi:hypothetical protein
MKVICIANSGKSLSAKYLIGNTSSSIFHVATGKEYSVFAVAVYRGTTLFLLSDENRLPSWFPADLFSITDPRVPQDWFSAKFPENEDGLQFLLGYEQMVFDDSHYDALLERSPEAIKAFRLAAQLDAS